MSTESSTQSPVEESGKASEKRNFVSKAKDNQDLSFEEALKRLEDIVARLDDPEVTIEDSVRYYEEGLRLSKQCSATLESATLRIEEIHQTLNSGTQERIQED